MNATALAVSVNKIITNFGNSVTYFPPKDTIVYNAEGDASTVWQTTIATSQWIEADMTRGLENTPIGKYTLKEGEVLMRNDVSIALRGKCVSNTNDYEIENIQEIRVKDTNIVSIVKLKDI